MTAEELFFRVSKIQRLAIVIAVAALLLVAFYFLVISDNLSVISSLEQQIARIKTDIINQENIEKQGPQLKARIQELKDKLETMVASLPEKQEIEQLLQTVTQLLSETHLISKKFVPGAEQVDTELYYAKIPISLSTTGDYQKQGAFLAGLNDLPRIVNVPSISLRRASGLSPRETELASKLDLIHLEADISGETYRRLTPEEIKRVQEQKAAKPGARRPPPRKGAGAD
ncbi:MAG: type 4a pilus biogenesis protein PilO [Thermodesulfobacteriota bacterium]